MSKSVEKPEAEIHDLRQGLRGTLVVHAAAQSQQSRSRVPRRRPFGRTNDAWLIAASSVPWARPGRSACPGRR